MKNNNIFYLAILTLVVYILCFTHRSLPTSKTENKDTIIYNIEYRDTTIYDIKYKDSTIIDYNAMPITDFDTITIRDTIYISLPMIQYHFNVDDIADIWVKGYNVTMDSTRFHLRECEINKIVTIQPRKLSIDAGLMLSKTTGGWSMMTDIRGCYQINEKWQAFISLGVNFNSSVNPYFGFGTRCKIY